MLNVDSRYSMFISTIFLRKLHKICKLFIRPIQNNTYTYTYHSYTFTNKIDIITGSTNVSVRNKDVLFHWRERKRERPHTVIANIKTQAYIVTGACVQHKPKKRFFNRITGMCVYVCVCSHLFSLNL